MDEFLLRALLGGLGIALLAGPIGAFMVWQRMAYFGDTLAHGALLGLALGYLTDSDYTLATIVTCLLLALLLVALQRQRLLASDTILGILSHGSLALGLVIVALLGGLRVDLNGLLFGDILSITRGDLAWIWGGGAVTLALLARIWNGLLALTVNEELAQVEGIPVARIRLVFMLLTALVVAVGMKIVGILLITALLVIPAATARPLSGSPERMALIGSLLGGVAVGAGIYASYLWDTPAGPSVVAAAVTLFVGMQLVSKSRRLST